MNIQKNQIYQIYQPRWEVYASYLGVIFPCENARFSALEVSLGIELTA